MKKVRQPKSVAPNVFRLGYLIHDVSRLRRTLYDQQMKPLGITRSQWWVLANLSRRAGDGILVSSDLAKLLDVSKVTLGRLIEKLENAGYVRREDHTSDGRAKNIHITDMGYELIRKMRAITEQLNERICIGLTASEVKATELNLLRLKDNLREMLAEETAEPDASELAK